MKLPPSNGVEFTPPPAGTHVAVCYRVIDLGTQESEFQGTKKRQRKVMVSWELPNELMPEGEHAGEPFTQHQRYTLSSNEKATMRKHLESWRGKVFTDAELEAFDMKNMIGKPCFLNLVHETKQGKTYCNIAAIMALPKGTAVPPLKSATQYLSLDGMLDSDFDAVFAKLSKGLQETIKKSPEYAELMDRRSHATRPDSANHAADLDDEVPF